MPDGRKQILSPFTGCRKLKAWKTREKYDSKKKIKFSLNGLGIILQRGMVRNFFR